MRAEFDKHARWRRRRSKLEIYLKGVKKTFRSRTPTATSWHTCRAVPCTCATRPCLYTSAATATSRRARATRSATPT